MILPMTYDSVPPSQGQIPRDKKPESDITAAMMHLHRETWHIHRETPKGAPASADSISTLLAHVNCIRLLLLCKNLTPRVCDCLDSFQKYLIRLKAPVGHFKLVTVQTESDAGVSL